VKQKLQAFSNPDLTDGVALELATSNNIKAKNCHILVVK
jgi:hypothetical protein